MKSSIIALSATADRSVFGKNLPRLLILSSSLLTDRMFLYSGTLDKLNESASVTLWATSACDDHHRQVWNDVRVPVEPFPAIRAFREVPHNYLRRLNEFVWDYRQHPPSRMSLMRHIRDKQHKLSIRSLKLPARVLALLRMERLLENNLERFLLKYERSAEATKRLRAERPDLVITTGPHRYEEPAVVSAAKRRGIPVMAFITSWDNLSTKNRMVFKYDGYLLWSERMKQELYDFYPQAREVPVYITGAPQFDVFFDRQFYQSREEFCQSQGLSKEKPIVLYALGSPNFLPEDQSVLYLAERVVRGELGDIQLLIRPHPIHDNAKESEKLARFAPRVVVQKTGSAGTDVSVRSQDENQILEWINTFRHSDVVVNLSSTAAIDAAIFDRPVVNLDFDPKPGQPNQALVKDINHTWTHFKPVAESGGLWLVNDLEEMIKAVKIYLTHPELHRDKRCWIAKYVCGHVDGKCGERMSEAILDFARNHIHKQFAPDPENLRQANVALHENGAGYIDNV